MKRIEFPVRNVRIQPDKFNKPDPGSTHVQMLAGMKTSCLHFSAFAAALVVLALIGGCAQLPAQHGHKAAVVGQPLARLDLPAGDANGKVSALLIAAEFALQNNHVAEAAADYAEAAQVSDSPAVAERALQLALTTHDSDSAQKLLERWKVLGASPHAVAAASARLAMLSGDRVGAERQFDLLLASGDVRDWKTFAATLLAARDTALAGRALEDIATPGRLPANESVWVALSQLGEHLGRHAFARKLADDAVRRFDGADSIRWAANLRLAAGDRAGALALYAKGVARHPGNPGLRLGSAALLGHQGEYGKALQVLSHGPQTEATWSARVGYAALARDGSALRRLYAELQRVPTSVNGSAFLLGQLAELMHHDRQALAWYGKVDPDSSHGFDARVRSAILLDEAGDPTRAHALAAQLQQDYADEPDNLRSACELDAQLYSRHGEHAKAIAVYDRGLDALPDDPELIYDRGVEEANAGNTDPALADFRKVLAQNPDNVDAMNALGFTLADANRDLPEATKLLRKALAAKPDAAAVMDSWGWLQYRLGNLDQAKAYLERAWDRQPDPDIGAHLGEVLWKLGQHRRAREVFGKVRTLDPHSSSLLRAERRLHL